MAIGIDLIIGTGIERGVIMGHGVISKIPRYPMYLEIYLLIFVTLFGIAKEFDMQTSSRIGRRGNERSTGTDTVIEKMLEIIAMIREEKAITANAEVKENTSAKTTENL
jgi:hypothetical protein